MMDHKNVDGLQLCKSYNLNVAFIWNQYSAPKKNYCFICARTNKLYIQTAGMYFDLLSWHHVEFVLYNKNPIDPRNVLQIIIRFFASSAIKHLKYLFLKKVINLWFEEKTNLNWISYMKNAHHIDYKSLNWRI